eukprot:TRINITY_DN4312_c0_g1_i7.p1 TRINITY_DN4312_c0_g1~~TRINITY_DN4312_c0_g1_i7.p1  ORF type:complete len:220 (-),score=9.11 TRINITY_DN4312_c0_g1_i7:326-910(-)
MCIRDRYDCCANCIESKMEHASLSFTTPTPSSSAIDMTFSMNIKYLLSQQFMRFIGQLSGGKYSSIREKRASSIYAFHKRNQVLLVVPIKRDATVGQHFDVIRKNDRQSRREHSVFQCTAFQLAYRHEAQSDRTSVSDSARRPKARLLLPKIVVTAKKIVHEILLVPICVIIFHILKYYREKRAADKVELSPAL